MFENILARKKKEVKQIVRSNKILSKIYLRILSKSCVRSIYKADGKIKDGGVNVGVNVGVKLSKTAQKVLDCIRENGIINAEKIAENVGKDKRTVERAIKSLKELGMIERNGSDKTGSWKVIE